MLTVFVSAAMNLNIFHVANSKSRQIIINFISLHDPVSTICCVLEFYPLIDKGLLSSTFFSLFFFCFSF